MKDLNISALGYIGNNAVTKTLDSGQSVTEFSLACQLGTKDKPKTVWVKCAMWNERGTKLCQYLLKGTQVLVNGDFANIETYTPEGGQLTTKLVIAVNSVRLLGRSDSEQSSAKSDNYPAQTYTPAAPYNQPDTDDLPF